MTNKIWRVFVILTLLSLSCAISKRHYTVKPRAVLPENYVKEIRPPSQNGEPVIVEFSIYIIDINSINIEDMDFRVDMFIRQTWTESRLNMTATDELFEDGDDYVNLPPEFFDNLWQPDPYIINSKISEVAMLTHKYSSVTLYRNKTVKYSARINAIIACQMEFQLYPMDVQLCPMFIESFSYNEKKLQLRWSKDGARVNPELKLLKFKMVQPIKLKETTGYTIEKEANFSKLIMYFRFERQIGHHLIQTFAPSSLVVMLSWFSFWIGLDAIPGRVTLIVTSKLILVTMFTGLKTEVPPVAYVKALDLWMGGCMVFIFAALGEFVVVKVLQVCYEQEKGTRIPSLSRILPVKIQASEKNNHCLTAWDVEAPSIHYRKQSVTFCKRRIFKLAWIERRTGREKILWKEIDKKSRIIFPAFFLLFVLFYWPILLLKKG